MNKKIGIISQARMTSTRLPGKILMLAGGHPLLEYHVNRLKWSGLPVYIATTINATDDPVAEFAKKNGVKYSRGSEDNVLSRYYDCAVNNELDVIVRVTSDCPLIDGNLIKEGMDKFLKLDDPNIYVSNTLERTFPRGFDYEIFSFQLLEDAYKNAVLDYDKEHVTPYIHQNRSGKVKLLNIPNLVNHGNFRICVDTSEDFELLKTLLEDYDTENMSYQQITQILVEHPELVEINAHIEQKK